MLMYKGNITHNYNDYNVHNNLFSFPVPNVRNTKKL